MRKIIFIITTLMIWSLSFAQQYGQVAKSLPEESLNNNYEKTGSSISVFNDYAAIGASEYNGKIGCVYVYHYNGTSWEYVAKLTASDGEKDDKLGISVSIYNDVIVAGSSDANAVYVYEKRASGWVDMTET